MDRINSVSRLYKNESQVFKQLDLVEIIFISIFNLNIYLKYTEFCRKYFETTLDHLRLSSVSKKISFKYSKREVTYFKRNLNDLPFAAVHFHKMQNILEKDS